MPQPSSQQLAETLAYPPVSLVQLDMRTLSLVIKKRRGRGVHLFATAYKQHMLERERQYHRNIGPLILAWYRAIDGIKAYKLCRNALFAWLERAQSKLGAYKEDGVARRRDQESYEADAHCLELRIP